MKTEEKMVIKNVDAFALMQAIFLAQEEKTEGDAKEKW